MANLFRRSRQSYDFPLSEIAAPEKKKSKARAHPPAPAVAPPAAAPAPAPAPHVEEPVAAEAPPASAERGEGEAETAHGEDAGVKRVSSTPQLREPLISRENIAPPPPVIKKTRKDFFLCIGLLLVFTVICVAGIVVLKLLVFTEGKEKLLEARRNDADAEHGVFTREKKE